MSDLNNLHSIFASKTIVKIYRKLRVKDNLVVREPAGWYRDFDWMSTTSLFLHFVLHISRKLNCCSLSECTFEIEYWDNAEKSLIEDNAKNGMKGFNTSS